MCETLRSCDVQSPLQTSVETSRTIIQQKSTEAPSVSRLGSQIKRRKGSVISGVHQADVDVQRGHGPVANVRSAGVLARFQMRRRVLPLWSSLLHGTMGKLLPTRAVSWITTRRSGSSCSPVRSHPAGSASSSCADGSLAPACKTHPPHPVVFWLRSR